jgi:uncharacterized protein (DUF2267 family)
MDQKVIFSAVAERTVLSHEESADLTRAVLEGLADQLSESVARRLADDLPEPLASPLRVERRRRKGAHPIQVDDFTRRVGEHTGLTHDDVQAGTGAVIAVLHETLGDEEYRHLIGQLPAEYAELAQATK